MPATAAVPPQAAATTMPSRRSSTPYAAATTRSSAMARTARPVKVARSTAHPATTSATPKPKAISVGSGRASPATDSERVRNGLTSEPIRWKSAVQMFWTAWIMMIITPKLTSREVNSASPVRSYTHCRAAPSSAIAGTVTTRVRIGLTPHPVASSKVRYAPSRIMPKWARLMTRSMPQDTDSPTDMDAYSPPSSIPVITACTALMGSPVRWGCPSRSRSLRRRRRAYVGRGALRRPDHHPVAVLDLLDAHVGVPEVVDLRVEGEVAVERGVHPVLPQVGAQLLVVQAAGALHRAHEDLPGV